MRLTSPAGSGAAFYLVPISSICGCLSGLAVQAVGVCAGQHPWKKGTKPCPIVGLRVGEGHRGKGPAVKAVLQGH